MIEINGFGIEDERSLRDALDFYNKILFHGNMRRNMSFCLQRIPELEIEGEVFPEDDACRTFVISIRNARQDDPIEFTLAHELVHCKQWAKKELSATMTLRAYKQSNGETIIRPAYDFLWHGSLWRPKPGEDSYLDSPWEIEAYGRSIGMWHRWLASKHMETPKYEAHPRPDSCNFSVRRDTGIVPGYWGA